MEKTLKELNKTWSDMEFELEPHSRTGLNLLKTSEELIETLEDNQVWKSFIHYSLVFIPRITESHTHILMFHTTQFHSHAA